MHGVLVDTRQQELKNEFNCFVTCKQLRLIQQPLTAVLQITILGLLLLITCYHISYGGSQYDLLPLSFLLITFLSLNVVNTKLSQHLVFINQYVENNNRKICCYFQPIDYLDMANLFINIVFIYLAWFVGFFDHWSSRVDFVGFLSFWDRRKCPKGYFIKQISLIFISEAIFIKIFNFSSMGHTILRTMWFTKNLPWILKNPAFGSNLWHRSPEDHVE